MGTIQSVKTSISFFTVSCDYILGLTSYLATLAGRQMLLLLDIARLRHPYSRLYAKLS